MISRRSAVVSTAWISTAWVATGCLVSTAPAEAQDAGSFDAFLESVRAEARRAGIREVTLRALDGLRPNARVIELDRNQPEFKLTWPQYRARVLPDTRLQAARDNYARDRRLLEDAGARYGVDPHIIVGIWGIESGFGANKGNYNLLEALGTLSWEGRRAGYFRGELVNALRILDAGDVSPSRLTGGYAGAMGQPQFMPSSYLRYAVDGDGDGRRDIWDSLPDVFGSIANYLSRSGWRAGEPWGQPVLVPATLEAGQLGRENRRTLGEWMRLGVRRPDGTRFSREEPVGGIIVPDGIAPGEGYLAYANFNVIRRYNPADFYVLAVGLLGDATT